MPIKGFIEISIETGGIRLIALDTIKKVMPGMIETTIFLKDDSFLVSHESYHNIKKKMIEASV